MDNVIRDGFIKKMREKATKVTSLLFLITRNAFQEKVLVELKSSDFELVTSIPCKEQDEQFVSAFATD